MPTFDVVVGSYGHHTDAPGRGRPGGALDPGF